MAGANFPRVKVWVASEDVVYSDLNAEFDNILNNLTAANVDDFSASVSQMQSTVDPGEVGTESLATSVAGEIQRLRFLIAEITGEDEWYESPVSSLLGLSNAIGTGLTDNRIVSGAVRGSGSSQPIFLVAHGAARTVTVAGSTTNFIYYVNGTEYTISTNVTLTGLTAAPSSQNTCLVDQSIASGGQVWTRHAGEDGFSLTVDNMGTEITALIGKFAAFKLAGAATEYFIGYVESATALTKCQRGFFFDSANAPVKRTTYTNNDTITLMKLTWVFAKIDGTLTATYTNPTYSADEPTSPALGDYWFDTANNTWKVYGVGSFTSADAQLIGVCIQDTTNTVAARSFEFFKNYSATNTVELHYNSTTQVKSRFPGSVCSVWGSTIKNDHNLHTWDITLDRDSGVSETASTLYYAYLTDSGDKIISDVRPYDRREDLLGYYHPHNSWRCVGTFFNDSGSDITATQVSSYFSRYDQVEMKLESTASAPIEIRDKLIRLSGSTATFYMPPAAKTKGQAFIIQHAGTSYTQLYTLTGFGAELIGAANTYIMHTAGETLYIYSTGTAYVITQHFATTPWEAYTPASTQGFGTIATVATYRKRIGEELYIRGRFVTGTTTAAEGRVSFTAGAETHASTASITTIEIAGQATAASVGTIGNYWTLIEPSVSYMTFSVRDGGSGGLTKVTGSALVGNTVAWSMLAKFPIATWNP